MKWIVCLLFVSLSGFALVQEETEELIYELPPEKKDTLLPLELIVEGCEPEAYFDPAYGSLLDFISAHIVYPSEAADSLIQGKVYVSFIVERDWKLTNVHASTPVHPLLDREAVRLFESMPKWKPALFNGKPVRSKMTLPIAFVVHD